MQSFLTSIVTKGSHSTKINQPSGANDTWQPGRFDSRAKASAAWKQRNKCDSENNEAFREHVTMTGWKLLLCSILRRHSFKSSRNIPPSQFLWKQINSKVLSSSRLKDPGEEATKMRYFGLCSVARETISPNLHLETSAGSEPTHLDCFKRKRLPSFTLYLAYLNCHVNYWNSYRTQINY